MRPIFATLVDPTHVLPLPGIPGAVFPVEGRTIDADADFWRACLADGSLRAADPPVSGAPPVETDPPGSGDPATEAGQD